MDGIFEGRSTKNKNYFGIRLEKLSFLMKIFDNVSMMRCDDLDSATWSRNLR